jgi:thiamine biosynthesis lipoprotein
LNMVKDRIDIRLMGSEFELIVVEKDQEASSLRLNAAIDEIRRIENLLTEFSDSSETAMLNKNAGINAVQVEVEVYQLIQRAVRISAMTQGAFDISSGVLKALYNFKQRGSEIPTPDRISKALECVGYHHIRLLPGHRIFLAKPGMHIGFGAIGKGYAADKVKSLWKTSGVGAGVINASGDLTAWGRQPDGSPWRVGIADPRDPSVFILWLPVENASVATSGNYEQYVEIAGMRYSHNIDPRSGAPVKDVKSVTIISASAELSDALATAVTVMGKDAGLHLINQLPDTHCILIDDKDRVFTSDKILAHANS